MAERGFWVTWSPDGAWRLAARNILGTARSNIVGLPTTGSGDSVVLGGTGAFMAPQMAPGNRWLAYVSDETGQWEVFVRPFPNVDSTRITVSPNGGVAPRWTPDGTGLYFVSADLQLMRAAVSSEPTFRVQSTERLLSLEPYAVQFMPYAYHYDVTNDGQRYILAIPRGGANLVWANGWLDALPESVR